MQFAVDTQLPSSFSDFLSNIVNKTNLGQFLVHKLLVIHSGESSLNFVVTLNGDFLTNGNDLLVQNKINYCTAEEADPRLIRHEINQAANGWENTIRTVDSDILVPSLSSVKRLTQVGVKSIFTVLVKKNGTEEIDLTKKFNKFGVNICLVLPFFHTFSGCNTSYSFYTKGKSIFWDTWMSFTKSTVLSHTFIELFNSPLWTSDENIRLLEYSNCMYNLVRTTGTLM